MEKYQKFIIEKDKIEKDITEILYKNSSDESDGLKIKFENINSVIQLLYYLPCQQKNEIYMLNKRLDYWGELHRECVKKNIRLEKYIDELQKNLDEALRRLEYYKKEKK